MVFCSNRCPVEHEIESNIVVFLYKVRSTIIEAYSPIRKYNICTTITTKLIVIVTVIVFLLVVVMPTPPSSETLPTMHIKIKTN